MKKKAKYLLKILGFWGKNEKFVIEIVKEDLPSSRKTYTIEGKYLPKECYCSDLRGVSGNHVYSIVIAPLSPVLELDTKQFKDILKNCKKHESRIN